MHSTLTLDLPCRLLVLQFVSKVLVTLSLLLLPVSSTDGEGVTLV
jgi:uncharacterized protein (DUF302 family)